MKKFRDIYYWNVVDEIKKGNTVVMVDKEQERIFTTNAKSVGEFYRIITECNAKDDNRYDFWVVEEVEQTEGENE